MKPSDIGQLEEDSLRELLGAGPQESPVPGWRWVPASFREFNYGNDFCGTISPLTEQQLEFVEAIVGTDPYQVFSPKRVVRELVLLLGKGSGKDLICSRTSTYCVHILACTEDPEKYLTGYSTGTPVDLINVAYTQKQADTRYFTYFRNTILSIPWFRRNFKIVVSGRVEVNKGTDLPLIEIGSNKIEFFGGKIVAYSEHAKNESYEGSNVVVWVMDEASAFTDKGEKANAKKVYGTLRSSVSSRYGNRGFGMILSYPRGGRFDFTVEKYRQSLHEDSIAGFTACPWEVLPPGLAYSGEFVQVPIPAVSHYALSGVPEDTDESSVVYVDVPIELRQEFIEDPEGSAGKYLCAAGAIEGRFIRHILNIRACVNEQWSKVVSTEELVVTYEGKSFVGQTIVDINRAYLQSKFPKAIWADTALTQENAALVLAHSEPSVSVGANIDEELPFIVVDAVLVWHPSRERRLEISLVNFENVLIDLAQRVGAGTVSSDRWVPSMKEVMLRSRVKFKNRSVRIEDWMNLRRYIYSGLISYPKYPLLIEELENLVRVSEKKVDHAENFTNDVAYCLAGVVKLLTTQIQRAARMPPPILGRKGVPVEGMVSGAPGAHDPPARSGSSRRMPRPILGRKK